MAIEYKEGIFVWILYSKITGDIKRAVTYNPHDSEAKEKTPINHKWESFIVTREALNNLHQFSVTKSGLERKVNRFLITK